MDHDAISVFQDILTILIVNPVIVHRSEVHRKHAMLTDIVLALRTLLVSSAHCAVLATTITHNAWRATVIQMVLRVFRATTTVNACAQTISMERLAINARRASTTSQLARNANAIRRE